jgi:hypothetical protein
MTMSALTADGRARVLNDGNQIPLLDRTPFPGPPSMRVPGW